MPQRVQARILGGALGGDDAGGNLCWAQNPADDIHVRFEIAGSVGEHEAECAFRTGQPPFPQRIRNERPERDCASARSRFGLADLVVPIGSFAHVQFTLLQVDVSPWVRRCKDVIAAHLSDLGGVENTSAAERSIIRRASVLTTELEQLEVRFALAGQAAPDELDLYQRTAGNLRRLLESVGIGRRPRDVSPTIEQIARHMANEEEAEQTETAADVEAETSA